MSKSPRKPKKPAVPPPALVLKERQALREILASDVFQRAMELATFHKPSVFGARTSITKKSGEDALHAAAGRLSEIAGWEMYEAALFMLAQEPQTKATQPTQHNFPDSGDPLYEPKKS